MTNSSSIESGGEETSPIAGDHCRSPDILDLAAARDLLERLRAGLTAGVCRIDASEVQRLSTPCAQVLFAAGVESERLGRPLRISNPSEAFETAINDLGLKDQFANWIQR